MSGAICRFALVVAAASVAAGLHLHQGLSAVAIASLSALLAAVALFASTLVRVFRQPGGFKLYLLPSSLVEFDLLRENRVASGFRYFCGSTVLLGTVLSLVLIARLLPNVFPYTKGSWFEAQVLEAFPEALELRIANGTLVRVSPPPEEGDVRVPIPQALFDFIDVATSDIFDSVGVTDLKVASLLLPDLFEDVAPPLDAYVRVSEFEVGNPVEVRVDSELAACGAVSWQFALPPLGGVWLPGVVEAVHPSSKLSEFSYSVHIPGSQASRAQVREMPAVEDVRDATTDVPSSGDAADGVEVSADAISEVPSSSGDAADGVEVPADAISEVPSSSGDVADGVEVPADAISEVPSSSGDAADGVEVPPQQAESLSESGSCRVQPSQMRRQQHILFAASDPELGSPGTVARNLSNIEELWSERALLVFEESRFAVLEGYSMEHMQHWQYSSSRVRGSLATLWHEYDDTELHSYGPLSSIVSLFCRQLDDSQEMVCRRQIGRDRYEEVLHDFPTLAMLLRANLHIPFLLLLIWATCVVFTVICRTFAVILIYMPTAYLACSLLRHVDTPAPGAYKVLGIALYTAVPMTIARRVGVLLWEVWGRDGLLPPVVSHVVQMFIERFWSMMIFWAVWSGFTVIQIRGHLTRQEHQNRIATATRRAAKADDDAATRTPKPEPAAAAAAELAAAGTSKPEDAVSLADAAPSTAASPDAEPLNAEAAAAAVVEGEASTAMASAATASGADGAPSAEEEDEASASPVCRICYGDYEVGRLISPCLCTGTMRFVHLECLNGWRMASANPRSFYRCDQCQYQYSFQRAFYANILRSAIVLHALTLVAFCCAVLLCSCMAMLMDWLRSGLYPGDALTAAVGDEVIEQLANDTDTGVEAIRERIEALSKASWNGIHLVHFASGLAMVGVSGLISMGFFWFPFMGARGHYRFEGPLILITLLVGTIRVMCMIYSQFKNMSGKLLQSAESMILEVGVAADIPQAPVPAPASPQATRAAMLSPAEANAGKSAAVQSPAVPAAVPETVGSDGQETRPSQEAKSGAVPTAEAYVPAAAVVEAPVIAPSATEDQDPATQTDSQEVGAIH